jgi:hypothetical protein
MKIFSPTISGSSQTSGSFTISGSLNVSQGITGSLLGTASWAINVVNGGGGSTNTGSLLTTASVVLNTITFTKGDGSTFPITVNTGSGGGGGSVGTLAQVTALGASTTVPITASIISASSFTGSLFGTASWANNARTSSFLPIGTYSITSSWAQSASNAVNARTASFVNNLNQNLSITGAVILSGSALPELRVIGETQFTGSVGSTGGFTGSLLGTSSWATNALTASFLPVGTYSITSSWAQSASNAINARTASFLPVGTYNITASWANNAVSASNALTASFVRNAVTASYVLNAVSSSFATTASHALNGGVTQIIAGTNVTISPVGGTGAVTINSSGGGGSTDTGSLLRTASVNLNTITFTKGDGSTFPITVNTGSGGGGPSYITPPFDTGSILYWDGTKVTGSDDIAFYDASNDDFKINTFFHSVLGESFFNQLATFFADISVEGGARIYQDTVADAIVVEKAELIGTTSGSYGFGSHILRNFSTTGPTLTPGRIVYISGSGQWAEAVASSTGSSTGVLGVVTTNANQNNVLLSGMVRVSQSLAGFTNGQPVYLATSSNGTITQTPPSTAGHVARYVGYVIDSGSRQIYFNPDFTWIQL